MALLPRRADALLTELQRIGPNLVIISGDLTQRAREEQYQQARQFLDSIRSPKIVVPGNHDVPLWNVYDRFFHPLDGYKKYISAEVNTSYIEDGLAAVGLNSTRSFTIKGGRLSKEQLDWARARLSNRPEETFKIVVVHHHFIPPLGFKKGGVIADAREALVVLEECGTDMILSGHTHRCYIGNTLDFYSQARRSIIVVNAGTAISLRGRSREAKKNTYNLIEIYRDRVLIIHLIWSDDRQQFAAFSAHLFPRPDNRTPYLERIDLSDSKLS